MSTATSNNVWRTTVPESTGNGDYTPCPAGSHPGRICGLFDVGSHPVERDDKATGGKKSVDVRQLVIVFELAEKQPGTGKPYTMGVKYTFSMNEKATLYTFVKNVTGSAPRPGQEFDPTSLLGKSVMVSVVHKSNSDGSKTYANVGAVTAYPKNFPEPVCTITPIAWSVQERTEFPEADWHPFLFGKSIKALAGESREVCGYGATTSKHSVTPPASPVTVIRNDIAQYPTRVQELMKVYGLEPGYTTSDLEVLTTTVVANMPKDFYQALLAESIPF